MRPKRQLEFAGILAVLALVLPSAVLRAADFFVSPAGRDDQPGTADRPFQTIARAQEAVRQAIKTDGADVVVHLAAGAYRQDKPLRFTGADSPRDGRRAVWQSQAGPGKARVMGSMPLTGWREHKDGVWKTELPGGLVFHTLYENGRRAWKARFPNHEHDQRFPTARGRYLVSEDGTPKRYNKTGEKPPPGPAWLRWPARDAAGRPVDMPAPRGDKALLLIYTGGKCDWMREVHPVESVDLEARKLVFKTNGLAFGVGQGARFFLEDDLAFLDAPGEFYHDDKAATLYYKPYGRGHPDALNISVPRVTRLVEVVGSSREACAQNICFDGLSFEESDGLPRGWWATAYGRTDGALIWMTNASRIEIRNCRLRNSGRSGVMMIGHNVENTVTGCLIEHVGVNGVTLSNRFSAPGGERATDDRCERNRVLNCRIRLVGEIHTYASCVNLFNVSDNEVGHCELHDSVRYAVTLRGNTGRQYGPPVSVALPPTRGNRMHHLDIRRCGQDGGDMGALHCANLNNGGDGNVNTFEQIIVADTQAVASVKDIAPDGIFLDWPKMSMDQVFRCVQILRSQGKQLRSHKPENGDSARTENVSWKEGFREDLMDRQRIGLTAEFPVQYE
ncbi:MAG: hypothetical protein BWX88_01121 [Planctomycetes bacterium ADurb.Bin126]|nr:MAG: hypothetical protein BWX88_01121 [Planctomycetes bacterium ADurb.Bin126]HOD82100.1 right-handed parallel beta-helix repeat-containing protein [Phycisphaerae bacterium]HQL74328.1 right-handed parallel beta-helix repeat-containing protein [Phycisphaerae bacterium]